MRMLLVITGILCLSAGEWTAASSAFQKGKKALALGDYSRARLLLQEAEANWDDPIAISCQIGIASYHLAFQRPEKQTEFLRDAVERFQCCLEPEDPHYPLALFWLGTCTLKQPGSRNLADLQKASGYFQQVLDCPESQPHLRTSALENLEYIRLRLGQITPPPAAEEKPPGDKKDPLEEEENRPSKNNSPRGINDKTMPGEEGFSSQGREKNREPRETQPRASSAPPAPGEGKPTPLEDRAELQPMTVQEAQKQLEKATLRILEEENHHRNQKKRPQQQGVRDW